MNEGSGKDFYRKGNSVKRGPFREPLASESWKVAVLIPFPKIGSDLIPRDWARELNTIVFLKLLGHLGKRFNRSLVRTGVWRGFSNRCRTLETAERKKNWKRALLFSAPNSGMHWTLVQKRSEHPRDILVKIPGYPVKKFGFPGFRRTYRTFWPPPLHVEDPYPTGKYPDQKVRGLGSFFFPEENVFLHVLVLCQGGILAAVSSQADNRFPWSSPLLHALWPKSSLIVATHHSNNPSFIFLVFFERLTFFTTTGADAGGRSTGKNQYW